MRLCEREAVWFNKNPSKARQHIVKHAYVDGAPDLIVEIISPSTAHIDRVKKKNQYAEFGVLDARELAVV